MVNFSLILPVQNQQDHIERVFLDIKKVLGQMKISYEVIFVENGSTDRSYDMVKAISKRHGNVFAYTAKRGYGNAVRAGLQKACGEYVCYMPSDGQIDVSVFPALWRIASSDRYHVVKIKRLNRESFLRSVTSWSFSWIVHILFKTSFIDVNGNPRILKRKYIKTLHLESKDSFIDTEFLIKAQTLGWSIKELPMKHLERAGGKSTRSMRTYKEFIANILRYKLNASLFYHKPWSYKREKEECHQDESR